MSPPWLSIGPAPGLPDAAEAVVEGVLLGLPVEAGEALRPSWRCLPPRTSRFSVLAMSAAIRQSAFAVPGASMNLSESRMRRSPFIEVRFISPGCAAGSMQMRRLGELGRVQIDIGDEQAALAAWPRRSRRPSAAAMAPRALTIASFTIWLRRSTTSRSCCGVVAGLEVVARPPGHHAALAGDELLVDVDLAVAGIGRPRVALLVTAHAHDAGAAAPDVPRREHDVHQRRLDQVVVVAPDDALSRRRASCADAGPPALGL